MPPTNRRKPPTMPLVQQAEYARDAAERQTSAAYDAAMKPAEAARQQAEGVRNAAYKQAKAAYEATKQQANDLWSAAYYFSYDVDGGPRSNVHEVMVKLIEHHRQRCRELHGL